MDHEYFHYSGSTFLCTNVSRNSSFLNSAIRLVSMCKIQMLYQNNSRSPRSVVGFVNSFTTLLFKTEFRAEDEPKMKCKAIYEQELCGEVAASTVANSGQITWQSLWKMETMIWWWVLCSEWLQLCGECSLELSRQIASNLGCAQIPCGINSFMKRNK